MTPPTDKELIEHARQGFSEGHAAKQLAWELAQRLETARLELEDLKKELKNSRWIESRLAMCVNAINTALKEYPIK